MLNLDHALQQLKDLGVVSVSSMDAAKAIKDAAPFPCVISMEYTHRGASWRVMAANKPLTRG